MTRTINLLFVLLLFTVGAQAQSYDFYASGNVGMAIAHGEERLDEFPGTPFDYDFDNGLVFAAAAGLINGQFRSEIEYSRQSNDVDSLTAGGIELVIADLATGASGKVTADTGLINAYYDIDMGGFFSPYISAGIGYTSVKSRLDVPGDPDLSGSDKDSTMAYQIGGGAGFAFNETITLELRYRYLSGQTLKYDESEAKFKTHNFSAGVRVTF